MSLFVVNRFTGEVEDEEEKEEKANTILDRIKAEAKARKEKLSRKIVTVTETSSPDHKESEGISYSKRKKKLKQIETKASSDDEAEADDNESIKASSFTVQGSSDFEKQRRSSDEKCESVSKEVEKDGDGDDTTIASPVDTQIEGPHEHGGFTILGDFKPKSLEKVHRVLPHWLSNPNVISGNLKTEMTIHGMQGLDTDLVKKLETNGITHFFPVQIQVIPVLLSMLHNGCDIGKIGFRPSDICVSAPTGSGKTLAFVLPIVQALKSRMVRHVRALVVLPVKDLAIQVYQVFQTYCKDTDLKVGLIVGQKTFFAEQKYLIERSLLGPRTYFDIIVATPGRLVDHITKTEGFDLTYLRFLVVDEADRMMEEINQDWLSHVHSAVYKGHRSPPGPINVANESKPRIPLQKLLYSATLSQNPEKLQQLNLFQPKLFTSVLEPSHTKKTRSAAESVDELEDSEKNTGQFIGKYTTPVGLTEYMTETTVEQKPLAILHFLHHLKFRNVLCFTSYAETTHRLYLLIKLVGDINVREISPNLKTSSRKRVLRDFAAGKIDILICTDVMARGMDIKNVKYVISYDVPKFVKTYIHRIGRTARAGKVGTAITLLEIKQMHHFKKMLREAGKGDLDFLRVKAPQLKPLVPAYKKALSELANAVKNENKKNT